jgi:hypothetical protein
MILPTPFGAGPKDGKVFGETPKTAVETTVSPQSNFIVPALGEGTDVA